MKPTVRVSIGGLAFNPEEDAYHILDDYLKALRRHFSGNPEADEIITDIESRLSELLQMRINGNDRVVSITDAREIIKIMGNPKDFDETVSGEANEEGAPRKEFYRNTENKDDSFQNFFKKQLYRDANNKIIGGVCSGFGHYFKIDSTAIRIILAGLIFLFGFLSFKIAGTAVLAYIVLWIVMPAARTFNQKLSMTGADPSIENIENRSQPSRKKYKGSAVGTILNVFINIVAGICAVLVFFILTGMIVSLIWLYLDTELFGLNNYLVLLGYNSIGLKIAIALAILIPPAGLLCLLIKILRRSSFTLQTLAGFIIGLAVWTGAVVYIGSKSIKFAHSHKEREEAMDNPAVGTKSDTLIIKLGDEYLDAIPQPRNPIMFYRGETSGNRQMCVLPSITVRNDTSLVNYKMEIRKRGFADNRVTAKRKAEALRLDYSITDSLITVNPEWYSNTNKWDMETFEIIVTAPRNKKVIIETPLNSTLTDIKRSHGCKREIDKFVRRLKKRF
ncbi:MAG: PspC domain-containing protein [Prevotella sp.]|jgi:phage shock protein PspC (stress-responsive transcriptional regulator)|nr:PspC domain-containing protein [Prevotella sp.]